MSSWPLLPSLQWYLVRANQIWNGTSCKVSRGHLCPTLCQSTSAKYHLFPFQILQSLWITSTVKSCLDSLRISACQLNTSMLDLSFHQTKESSQEACWVLWMVSWQQSCERAKNKQERMRPYKLPYTPCSAAAEWETDSNSSPSGALTLSTWDDVKLPFTRERLKQRYTQWDRQSVSQKCKQLHWHGFLS